MKVETYLFGAIEVSPEKIINFPNGMVGFEKCTRYTMVHEEDGGEPVSFTLQSLDDPKLAFQVVDPGLLGYSYQLELTDAESALLQSPAPEDVLVMQLLFKNEQEGKASIAASLRAPLVINAKARVGLQKVMQTFRHNIVLSNLSSAV